MNTSAYVQSNTVIETEGLSKIYRMGNIEVHALRSVNLKMRSGEFVALMGPSGSGKSTLMHLLGCLDTPTSGRYFLEGRDVVCLSDDERSTIRSRSVGFIFQNFNLLPRLSALANVILPLLYQGYGNGAEQAAESALCRVGLSERLHHSPSEMSGGEKQRVAIARALITDPALILADEPTGNLDSVTGDGVLRLLAELHREGRTILMVTHSDHAASFAERVVLMRDGHIEERKANHVFP